MRKRPQELKTVYLVASATSLEREDCVLLRRDGSPVPRGRMEVPVFERRKALCVNVRSKTLQHGLLCDFTALVNRDFNDFIPRRCRELPRIDAGIGSRNREC